MWKDDENEAHSEDGTATSASMYPHDKTPVSIIINNKNYRLRPGVTAEIQVQNFSQN